jgi:DNA uptake protein ComE-like DNA-binding protein
MMKNKSVLSLCLAASSLAMLAGCVSPQNPQELKEKTAKATAEAKRDAKAVAEGIREGWSRDKPLDLNSATKDQIATLPGITSADADRIVANRPYQHPDELESRHILPKQKYDRIADLVKTK